MQMGSAFTLPRDVASDLDDWLAPFLDMTGRSTRRKMAPLYVRGLLGPDGPKSIQPMAERLGLPGHDQLHHFVTSPAWDDAPLWRGVGGPGGPPGGGGGGGVGGGGTGFSQKRGPPGWGGGAEWGGAGEEGDSP